MMRAPARTPSLLRAGPEPAARVRPILAVLIAYALVIAALLGPASRLSAMPGAAPEWCRGDRAGEPASGAPNDHVDCALACAQGQSPSPPPAAAAWMDPASAWQTALRELFDRESAPAFPPAAPQCMRGPPTA